MPAASSSDGEAGGRPRAAIVGVAGTGLSEAERRLFAAREPYGFILFRRNCHTPEQVRRLVTELGRVVGPREAPVLIDQEGGRVVRLGPPHWTARAAAGRIGGLAERDLVAGREAAWLHARLIAADLHALGITVDCAPVLDLALSGQSEVVGDRAFAADPNLVGALGRATMEGLLAGGVLPVIKHLPGHGRAVVDSHLRLPVVETAMEDLAASDWRPFVLCRDAPLGMTAHILYPTLDSERPATQSAPIIDRVIREEIGFEGALLSDDLSMGALGGTLAERTALARGAGCDLALHCNGDLDEMREILDAAGDLSGAPARRVERALARRGPAQRFDAAAAEARLAALLGPSEPLGRAV